ncbi:hypothetical protein IVA95_16170 [Bradyrhizobium sp. 157]|uniref:hypothetical protein n=1 Tax=Bradyrhizobium sp. 157 TaxID=2782631 RepID=UPI001FF8139D|nr:hypothetical protein [Bradyrhizobium sp. 157]MCK1639097.1 hypothetical protein [Bradyrhizobium sp. 157]
MTDDEVSNLCDSLRCAGFEIDNDDNPRSTSCEVFIAPPHSDDDGFQITLVVNGCFVIEIETTQITSHKIPPINMVDEIKRSMMN